MTRTEREARNASIDLHQAVADTRTVVKSLARHARTATQLLTDLEERLERFERDHARQAQEAQNGTPHRTDVEA